MSNSDTLNINAVMEAVQSLSERSSPLDELWLEEVAPCGEEKINQFVIFLKPEVTNLTAGVSLELILEELKEILHRNAVGVSGVRVVSGNFFQRSDVMAQHYGVINSISRLGVVAVTEGGRMNLEDRYSSELKAGYDVLGGHQFLQEYLEFSPFALSVLFDSLGSERLAPGTYARSLLVEGRGIVLLNGFHPYQLERFTRPEAVTVLIEARSRTPWRVLRESVAGTTDPSMAQSGSFRRVLLEKKADFKLAEVGRNANGLHLSAGPLEGMVEVRRFFSSVTTLDVRSTCFGSCLITSGISESDVDKLTVNPQFAREDAVISAFDLTEEVDASSAAQVLKEALETSRCI